LSLSDPRSSFLFLLGQLSLLLLLESIQVLFEGSPFSVEVVADVGMLELLVKDEGVAVEIEPVRVGGHKREELGDHVFVVIQHFNGARKHELQKVVHFVWLGVHREEYLGLGSLRLLLQTFLEVLNKSILR